MYPSDWPTPKMEAAPECLGVELPKLDRLYHVSVRRHADGHACTQLVWLDMGGRRVVTEGIMCLQGVGDTRAEMLRCIVFAAQTALRALDAGVEYAP